MEIRLKVQGEVCIEVATDSLARILCKLSASRRTVNTDRPFIAKGNKSWTAYKSKNDKIALKEKFKSKRSKTIVISKFPFFTPEVMVFHSCDIIVNRLN